MDEGRSDDAGGRCKPVGEADGRVESASTRRARILLVDDNADALSLLEFFLQRRGFAVMAAVDVDTACAKVAETVPDLIITDYIMPGQTGIDLCRRLRARGRTRDIPIILHTACAIQETQTGLFDALVGKPVNLQVLDNTICRLLAGRDRGAAGRVKLSTRAPIEVSRFVGV